MFALVGTLSSGLPPSTACSLSLTPVCRLSLQCVGRALRGKTDYGIMVFADKVRD